MGGDCQKIVTGANFRLKLNYTVSERCLAVRFVAGLLNSSTHCVQAVEVYRIPKSALAQGHVSLTRAL